jgi:hypothetical protein
MSNGNGNGNGNGNRLCLDASVSFGMVVGAASAAMGFTGSAHRG